MFIAKLTDEGEALVMKSAGVRGHQFFGEIEVTEEGRLYFAGLNEGVSLKKAAQGEPTPVAFVGFLEKGITERMDPVVTHVETKETISLGMAADAYLIYPNPASQVLYVNSSDREAFEIQLYGISGKLIWQSRDQSEYGIPVYGYESGMYFLKLIRKGESEVRKVLVD